MILRVLLRMPTETEQDGLVKGHHIRVFLFMTLFPYSIYDLWGKVQVLSNVIRILTMNQMNPNVQKTGERRNCGCSLHPKYIDSWNVKWTRQSHDTLGSFEILSPAHFPFFFLKKKPFVEDCQEMINSKIRWGSGTTLHLSFVVLRIWAPGPPQNLLTSGANNDFTYQLLMPPLSLSKSLISTKSCDSY